MFVSLEDPKLALRGPHTHCANMCIVEISDCLAGVILPPELQGLV